MPPVRRYLRITKYSVLECRIYLDNPADAHRWLLNERSPALPRVVESVRPLVLPKLREENAKAKNGKGGKRKGWKDTVVHDDFEVSVFLTETSSRHAILRKEKRIKAEKSRLGILDGSLVGAGTQSAPVEIADPGPSVMLRENSGDEKPVNLKDIPEASSDTQVHDEQSQHEARLEVSDGSENGDLDVGPRRQQIEKGAIAEHTEEEDNDKKKVGFNTSYDGFSIHGRILCLVVKRRGLARGRDSAGGAGQAVMEEWIASTQLGDTRIED